MFIYKNQYEFENKHFDLIKEKFNGCCYFTFYSLYIIMFYLN